MKKVENRGLPESLFQTVVRISDQIPAHQFFAMELRFLAPGEAGLEMTVNPAWSNSYGITHGGAIFTLADSAMGAAIRTINLRVLTLEINLNFFGPVELGETISAVARVVHTGSSTVVAEAEVFNRRSRMVSKSRATFYQVGPLENEKI